MEGPAQRVVDVVDLLGPNANVTASTPEDPVVRNHRLLMEKLYGGFGMLIVAILLTVGVFMVFKGADAEVRKLGSALLGAILTGALGFMAGRGTK